MAKSLRDLLAYDGDDIEDVFCLRFTVTEERFGERTEVALTRGGEDTPVRADNREEYVRLYCDYYLNKSVKRKFDAFVKGFRKVQLLQQFSIMDRH